MRSRDTLATLVASAAVLGAVAMIALAVRGGTLAEDVTGPAETAAPGIARPAPTLPEADPDPEDLIRPVPLHVRIGAIRVDASVVRVGLEDDGAMEIPERVAEIGWYDPDELGVTPGAPGTAVLAGHVDSRSQGRGALYDLRNLRVGEIIELDLSDGTSQQWRISEVIQYPKDELPFSELFVWSGPPRLVVITCGGEFDRTERSYTDNIVVYAEPLDDPPAASPSSVSPVA